LAPRFFAAKERCVVSDVLRRGGVLVTPALVAAVAVKVELNESTATAAIEML